MSHDALERLSKDELIAIILAQAAQIEALMARVAVLQGSGVRAHWPNPRLGSIDADIAWAPQRQHAVEGTDRHRHLGRPTFVYTRAQPVADHSFPSRDGRLDFSTPIVA
jgi:hypothetical protein